MNNKWRRFAALQQGVGQFAEGLGSYLQEQRRQSDLQDFRGRLSQTNKVGPFPAEAQTGIPGATAVDEQGGVTDYSGPRTPEGLGILDVFDAAGMSGANPLAAYGAASRATAPRRETLRSSERIVDPLSGREIVGAAVETGQEQTYEVATPQGQGLLIKEYPASAFDENGNLRPNARPIKQRFDRTKFGDGDGSGSGSGAGGPKDQTKDYLDRIQQLVDRNNQIDSLVVVGGPKQPDAIDARSRQMFEQDKAVWQRALYQEKARNEAEIQRLRTALTATPYGSASSAGAPMVGPAPPPGTEMPPAPANPPAPAPPAAPRNAQGARDRIMQEIMKLEAELGIQ